MLKFRIVVCGNIVLEIYKFCRCTPAHNHNHILFFFEMLTCSKTTQAKFDSVFYTI